jgi:hypothetical protein
MPTGGSTSVVPTHAAGDLLVYLHGVNKQSSTVPTLSLNSSDWTLVHNESLNVAPTYLSSGSFGTDLSFATLACYKFAESSSESLPTISKSTTVDFEGFQIVRLQGVPDVTPAVETTTAVPVATSGNRNVTINEPAGSTDATVRVQFRYQGAQVGGGSTNGPEYLGDIPNTWLGAQNNGNYGAIQLTFENGTTNPVVDEFFNVSFVVVSIAAFTVKTSGIFVGAVVF